MSFNPFNTLVDEMKSKMKAIKSDPSHIAIINSNGKYYYFDEGLDEHKSIIEDFNKNLNIDIGQYSLPISAPIGFFRIFDTIIVVIFLEGGQSSNLLLFQGIIKNYTPKIINYVENIDKMDKLEKQAHKIIKLKKKVVKTPEEIQCPLLRQEYRDKKFSYNEGLILKYCTGDKPIVEIIEAVKLPKTEIISTINQYKEKGWIEIVTNVDDYEYQITEEKKIEILSESEAETKNLASEDIELFPILLEKYRDKRFSFEIGQIIQYCDGKHSIKEIAELVNRSETDILDVINEYQSKGWIKVESK
ncbi:MAG: hypothetical protein EU549_02250 [Promethearchaeota archaeon]|nr:MAG: hypothetical protein EU549_02250 [Candidatus Lokiarchaeota archaeon]